MGFLDRAKAAAGDMMAKADTALAGAGLGGPGAAGATDSGSYLRDLGVLAYLEQQGREAPPGERERVVAALAQLESSGASLDLRLRTVGAPAPGTPGGPGYVPPPPGVGTVPPPPAPPSAPPPPAPGPTTPPPPPAPPAPAPSLTTPPPPPPPTWT